MATRASILDAAKAVVTGQREATYSGPERSFETIARFWTAYLDIQPAGSLTGADVAAMMALLKIARLGASPAHEDSWVDLAGYAACGGEIGVQDTVKHGTEVQIPVRVDPEKERQAREYLEKFGLGVSPQNIQAVMSGGGISPTKPDMPSRSVPPAKR